MLFKNVIQRFEHEAGFYSLRKNATSVQYFNLSGISKPEDGSYTTGYNYTYSYTFKFENEFEPKTYVGWMHNYFWVSNYVIAVYLLMIFMIQHYMKDRPPMQLRKTLFVWNICLAIFSAWGAVRVIPEMLYLLSNFGGSFSVCYSGKP